MEGQDLELNGLGWVADVNSTLHWIFEGLLSGMSLPLLMPDAESLFRSQKMSNWGYASYAGRLATLQEDPRSGPFKD